MFVLLLFFGSGATALIYEVVWSKYLALMFGSTVQAQTVVLAVFMGGLALGNRIFGARADRASRPLALYGLIEVAIGIYALFFADLHRAADALFVRAGSQLVEAGAGLLLLKGLLSVGLLLGPTVLMGGTLPLIAAWLSRQSREAGRWSARFYSVNSLGAVAGAGVAGFYLVRAFGLVASLQMTALVNVCIGLTAVLLARHDRGGVPSDAAGGASVAAGPEPAAGGSTGAESLPPLWLGSLLVALTGGVSMGLEVLASRSLTLIFGASLQAFAIVLMAFILGIGLGSAAIASPRWRRLSGVDLTLGLVLSAAAVLGLLVVGIEQWVVFYLHAKSGLAASEVGYRYHQLLAALMSLVVLGLPAGLLGAVLPLWIRTLASRASSLGDRVGRLLTWNTLGAVAGVLLTGFGLMPWIGLRGSYFALLLLLCLAAAAVAWTCRRRTGLAAAAGLAVVLVGLGLQTGEGWRHVLSSGVFRARLTEVDPQTLERRRQHVALLFYEDAADATVTVELGDGLGAPADLGLRINGKPEASTRADMSTQLLVAHLPMLARPESREVFMLGLASGISCGALLAHPLDRLVVAENCEPVLRAARFFTNWNRGVLTHPATQIVLEDARTVLKLSPRQYDVIISQPSNPWFASVGSVFSREYYELAASRLKPGGLMTQWFHIYEMHDGIVDLVLRTFGSVFPCVEIWDTGAGDIVLLGSRQPWSSSPDAFRAAFDRPQVRQDLAALGFPSPELLWTRMFASQRTAFAIPGPGPIQSDAFPVLEYEAPKAFYLGKSALRLLVYDERTWQKQLTFEARQRLLGSLPLEQLGQAFSQPSVNRDLPRYLIWCRQVDGARGSAGSEPEPMPCAFRPATASPYQVPVPPDADDTRRRLVEAENALWANSDSWRSASSNILEALRLEQLRPDRNPVREAEWAHFAALAVRAHIAHRDPEGARSALAAGFQASADAPELHYLLRILERESGPADASKP